jgi:hypothetical protein
MNDKQRQAAAAITKGADIHRVAARLIERENGKFILWRSKCAATLSIIYGIPLLDAKAVISEMAVD